MAKKISIKYVVSKVVIENNEMKFTEPKMFDSNVMAKKYFMEMNAENGYYIFHELNEVQ
jgi:hypothetical protein